MDGRISRLSFDGGHVDRDLSWTEEPETQTVVRLLSLLGEPQMALTSRLEERGHWGCSGGFVLGNAGVVGAGVLLGDFPVVEGRLLPAGLWQPQQRCIVELLLGELGLGPGHKVLGRSPLLAFSCEAQHPLSLIASSGSHSAPTLLGSLSVV